MLSAGADAGDGAAPDSECGAYYPDDQVHSPMTAAVVARLRAIYARRVGQAGIAMKVGDSITARAEALTCLANPPPDWGVHGELEPTRAFFAGSFGRVSVAARLGARTTDVITAIPGSPSYLAQEIGEAEPAFALVEFGTNEAPAGASGVHAYALDMAELVDQLIARGIIPVIYTPPPRYDESSAHLPALYEIARHARAIAASRCVPLVDYYRAVAGIPAAGLGPDMVHPAAYSASACDFSAWSLDRFGANVRNLVTLEALHRVRRFILNAEAPEGAP